MTASAMYRLLLALALVLPLLGGCSQTNPADAPAAYVPTGPIPDDSVYLLDGEWTTETGTALRLEDLRGRPAVVTMGFTSCAWACPLLIRDMRKIAAELPDGADVQYVLVTIDPERDTPAALKRFKEAHLLADDWTLLRGDAMNVRMLAALLGTRYKAEADGQFSHSNIITILNREGQIVTQQEGIGADPSAAVAAVEGLLATR